MIAVRCADCGNAAKQAWAVLHKRDCPQAGKPDWLPPVARYDRFEYVEGLTSRRAVASG